MVGHEERVAKLKEIRVDLLNYKIDYEDRGGWYDDVINSKIDNAIEANKDLLSALEEMNESMEMG